MNALTDQLHAMHVRNLEIAAECARIAWTGSTRLAQLHLSAAGDLLTAVRDVAGDPPGVGGTGTAIAPAVSHPPLEVGVTVVREALSIALDTQVDLARMIESRLNALTRECVAVAERYAVTVPAGTPAFAEVLRESFAAVRGACDLLAQATRQLNALAAAGDANAEPGATGPARPASRPRGARPPRPRAPVREPRRPSGPGAAAAQQQADPVARTHPAPGRRGAVRDAEAGRSNARPRRRPPTP